MSHFVKCVNELPIYEYLSISQDTLTSVGIMLLKQIAHGLGNIIHYPL